MFNGVSLDEIIPGLSSDNKEEEEGGMELALSRRVICISEICRRRLCSGWPTLLGQSGREAGSRQAVSRLNYWSFAQHALDREREESDAGQTFAVLS